MSEWETFVHTFPHKLHHGNEQTKEKSKMLRLFFIFCCFCNNFDWNAGHIFSLVEQRRNHHSTDVYHQISSLCNDVRSMCILFTYTYISYQALNIIVWHAKMMAIVWAASNRAQTLIDTKRKCWCIQMQQQQQQIHTQTVNCIAICCVCI